MNLKKITCAVLAASLMSICMAACNNGGKPNASEPSKASSEVTVTGVPQLEKPKSGETVATISVENYGDIKVRLFQKTTPKAFENFVTHAKEGYYNGLIFHRVIKDFMIQGGDPDGIGTGGVSIWGKAFGPEPDSKLHHYRGAFAMAQAGVGKEAKIGSQFYIVQNKFVDDSLLNYYGLPTTGKTAEVYKQIGGAPWLDGDYTVFGQVYEGMDVVDKIAEAEVDAYQSKPLQDIKIKTIAIDTVE